MSVPTPPLPRPWRIVATEITEEQDSERISELVTELNRALEAQGLGQTIRAVKLEKPS